MVDQRTEYCIQQRIDELIDEVIFDKINNLAAATHLYEKKQKMNKQGNAMGEPQYMPASTQFSKLIGLTQSTTSIEVIINWIKYQSGRYAEWQELNFGQMLAEDLESLKDYAIGLTEEVSAKTADEILANQDGRRYYRGLWLRLVQQYVGMLRRCVIAYRRDDISDEIGEIAS